MSMLNMISFIQYSTVFYKQKNKEWKRNKIINIGNEKGKLILCLCYNCVYIGNINISINLQQKSSASLITRTL